MSENINRLYLYTEPFVTISWALWWCADIIGELPCIHGINI